MHFLSLHIDTAGDIVDLEISILVSAALLPQLFSLCAHASQRHAQTRQQLVEMCIRDRQRTQDILGYLGAHRREGQFLCGFSMETRDMVENSIKKLQKKHVDMIAANNVKVTGAGFGTDTNLLTLITQDGTLELPLVSKLEAAHLLLDQILARRCK